MRIFVNRIRVCLAKTTIKWPNGHDLPVSKVVGGRCGLETDESALRTVYWFVIDGWAVIHPEPRKSVNLPCRRLGE
jgi:hypothetical protein